MVGEVDDTRVTSTMSYEASWVDRLQEWLAARRLPTWLVYALAWLGMWALVSVPVLLSGITIPAYALRVHVGFSANSVFFLAATHYLDSVAQNAIAAFRPALKRDDSSYHHLVNSLTTMPAQPVLLFSLLGAALPLVLSPVSVPAMRQYYLATSPLVTVIHIGLAGTLSSATFVVFLFHTIRQMRIVSRVHRQHTLISLFRLQPLYALSSFTARTALVLVMIGSIAYATVVPSGGSRRPLTLSSSSVSPNPLAVGFGYLALSVSTAAVVFGSPLIGLHRMLVKEKSRCQAETDQRLERTVEELHRLIDDGNLEDMDALDKAISSLVMEREIIRKTPTWPWSPGAFGVLASAVVLPILVWLLQILLERILLP